MTLDNMSPQDRETHDDVLENWEFDKQGLEEYLTGGEGLLPLAWALIKRAEEDLEEDKENPPPYILPGEAETHLQELKSIAARLRPDWEEEYKAYYQE